MGASACRRFAPRLNHRHADFQSRAGSPEALCFNELPGRPLPSLQHNAGRCGASSRKTHAKSSALPFGTPVRSLVFLASNDALNSLGRNPVALVHRHRSIHTSIVTQASSSCQYRFRALPAVFSLSRRRVRRQPARDAATIVGVGLLESQQQVG